MSRGLSHLKVIELGTGVTAPTAGKLLAELGATVLKIEPPGGDPERTRGPFRPGKSAEDHPGGGFLYLNGGKRSLELDLREQEGRERLWELAAGADLVIHNLPPAEMEPQGVTYERLARENPRLVLLSLTPFGLTGPHRDYHGNELIAMHGGGWGWLCPGKGSPVELPPLRPFGRHAETQAGLHGAAVALGACFGAAKSGVGDHIDFSGQEMIAFLIARHFASYTYMGETDKRTSPTIYEPYSIYPCSDGYLYMIVAEQSQWARLVALMGNPDWAQGLELRKLSVEKTAWVKEQVSAWTITHTKEELFRLCQQERVGVAPIFSFTEIFGQEQLLDRGYLVPQTHPRAGELVLPGAPCRLNHDWWRPPSPAPELDEARKLAASMFPPTPKEVGKPPATWKEGQRPPAPLEGVRVLDLSWVWAGPHCTEILALLGAEVIRVESSVRVDLTRRSREIPAGMEPGLNRCGYFNQVNQGKQSIAVNLATPEGIAMVEELAAISDVMVSNFGTGVMEKLGLAPEKMQAINPRLIVAAVSGFGQTGPARLYLGYGPLVTAVGGLVGETGYENGVPADVGIAYGDPNGGVYTAVAILAALNARHRPGPDQETQPLVIDTSMWEAMLSTSFDGWMNHALGNPSYPTMGNHDPYWAPHNLYRCLGEDAWVAIAVTSEAEWAGLCQGLERPDWSRDPRFRDAPSRKAHEAELDRIIAEWCAGRERWEVTRLLQAHGVPAFPCMDSKDLVEDPHLIQRDPFTRYDHAETGVRLLMGPPWRMTHRARANEIGAPLLGQHTDEVLERLLGRNAEQRAELRAKGVIE